MGQDTAQVFRQVGRVGITLGGLFLQCLGHDGVDVATQRPRTARGVRPPGTLHLLGQGPRHAIDSRLQPRQRRRGRARRGVPTPEQFVQQHAQGVDIGGGRHLTTLQLLGRGIRRRESRARVARQLTGVTAAGLVEQLGDAEVQQLELAIGTHQHVRGLEVAVQDQPRVRVRDRISRIDHQLQALRDRQDTLLDIPVDMFAVNEFQDQVGLMTVWADAGIQESRDVRLIEPSQDAALALESGLAALTQKPGLQELDGYLSFVASICPACEPHLAHATTAQFAFQRVWAQSLARQIRWRLQGRPCHETLIIQLGLASEKRFKVGNQRGVFRLHRSQPSGTLGRRQLKQFVQHRRQ
jgi:hypothetical protein